MVAYTRLTRVLDKRAPGGDLPQLGHRVLPAGQDVLGVLGEDGRADLGAVVGLVESGDAAVGHAVPYLDAAVLAGGDVAVGARVVGHTADGVRVLVQRVARDEALEGVDVVEAQRGVLRAHQQEVTRGVEGDRAQHLRFLAEGEGKGRVREKGRERERVREKGRKGKGRVSLFHLMEMDYMVHNQHFLPGI